MQLPLPRTLDKGRGFISPKINRNGQALRHNFEKRPGEREEEDAESHERFLCVEIGLLEAEDLEEWPTC